MSVQWRLRRVLFFDHGPNDEVVLRSGTKETAEQLTDDLVLDGEQSHQVNDRVRIRLEDLGIPIEELRNCLLHLEVQQDGKWQQLRLVEPKGPSFEHTGDLLADHEREVRNDQGGPYE